MKSIWVVTQSTLVVDKWVPFHHIFENEARAMRFYKANKHYANEEEHWFITESILITEDMYTDKQDKDEGNNNE